MKLSAIVSRATMKDYVDLYFILQGISLADLLLTAQEKLPNLDQSLILKSLVYFKDLTGDQILFYKNEIPFSEVEKFLETKVMEYIDNNINL
jgi:hypothetical protein